MILLLSAFICLLYVRVYILLLFIVVYCCHSCSQFDCWILASQLPLLGLYSIVIEDLLSLCLSLPSWSQALVDIEGS